VPSCPIDAISHLEVSNPFRARYHRTAHVGRTVMCGIVARAREVQREIVQGCPAAPGQSQRRARGQPPAKGLPVLRAPAAAEGEKAEQQGSTARGISCRSVRAGVFSLSHHLVGAWATSTARQPDTRTHAHRQLQNLLHASKPASDRCIASLRRQDNGRISLPRDSSARGRRRYTSSCLVCRRSFVSKVVV
jgi:hypothetical protein